jgi:hypothetical protein
MKQNIGALQKLLQKPASRHHGRIQRHSALIGIQGQKQAAALGMRHVTRKWPMLPGAVASLWPLDFDDLSPKVGQELTAIRYGNSLSEFHDPHAS